MLGLTLATDLAAFFDSMPEGEVACAERWASIISTFTTAIVPAVDPASHEAARLVLQGGLVGMKQSGLATFDTAFAAYATALAAAMIPASATPPPAPVSTVLTPVLTAGLAGTHGSVSVGIAVAIRAWFTTGLSSTAVPWT